MLKLHGFPVSNYTNMVQLALLEKGVPFEYVMTIPDQSEALLARSPRGKVPFLETPQGFISETSAILDYLEERGEGKPLLPADPFARAQVRALMREIELYLELAGRTCYAEAFFGARVAEAIKAKARDDLATGFATLRRHGRFAPFVAGDQFTLADIVFLYGAPIANTVAQRLFGVDALGEMPAARALLQRLGENPNVQAIARNHDAAMPAFIAAMRAKVQAAR
jgi:glutathione S-transferase